MMVEQKDLWYALRNPNKGDFHCFSMMENEVYCPTKELTKATLDDVFQRVWTTFKMCMHA